MKYGIASDFAGFAKVCSSVFGDDESYIMKLMSAFPADSFFAASDESGKTLSVMCLFPARYVCGEFSAEARYLYAVATLPEYRGKGISRSLFAEAARISAVRHIFTVPASRSLFSFYASQGFESWSRCAVHELVSKTDEPLSYSLVSASEYRLLREEALRNTPHMDFSPEILCLAGQFLVFAPGKLAIMEKKGNGLVFHELIGLSLDEAALYFENGTLIRAQMHSEGEYFSMHYGADLPEEGGFFGPAFD